MVGQAQPIVAQAQSMVAQAKPKPMTDAQWAAVFIAIGCFVWAAVAIWG
jgi:hypothetical protein